MSSTAGVFMPAHASVLTSLATVLASGLIVMLPSPAMAAELCVIREIEVTIDLNVSGHPDPNRADADVILGTPGVDTINSGGGSDVIVADDGNDVIDGGDGIDYICGEDGADSITGGADSDYIDGGSGNDSLTGGGGNDLVFYNKSAAAVNANLDSVSGTAAVGSTETDTLIGIEGLYGSRFNDTVTGDAEANPIYGNDGKDTLKGGDGDDTFIGDDVLVDGSGIPQDFSNGPEGNGADNIQGGAGTDLVHYGGDHADGVVVRLGITGASGNSTDGAAGSRDTVTSVEGMVGTVGNDTLTGDTRANEIHAMEGNDTVDGGPAGADNMSGGDGFDTLSYAIHAKAVTASLADGSDNAGDGFGEFESVLGSKFNDRITGSDSNDRLNGAAGNDMLIGGLGADRLDGGVGTDSVNYSDRSEALFVKLDNVANDGSGQDGPAGARDNVLSSVENVFGGEGNDTLAGSSGANRLYGLGGADRFFGFGGNDTFTGGTGADRFDGGSGVDTATYSDRTTAVNLTIDNVANDGSSLDGPTSTTRDNILTTVENLIGGSANDLLSGSASANRLTGMKGADRFYGRQGNDALIANDHIKDVVLNGGSGTDTVARDSGDPVPVSVP